jgi:hypothetical protein
VYTSSSGSASFSNFLLFINSMKNYINNNYFKYP